MNTPPPPCIWNVCKYRGRCNANAARLTELELQLAGMQPHALKEKLRSAEARIAELEMQLEKISSSFYVKTEGQPVTGVLVGGETPRTAIDAAMQQENKS